MNENQRRRVFIALCMVSLACAVIAVGPDGNRTVPRVVRACAYGAGVFCGLMALRVRFLTLAGLMLSLAALPGSRAEAAEARVGIASWYGESHRGRLMANGRPFNPDAMTCASWHHPLGTVLRVTRLETGKSVLVTVTDRGPARRLKREVDLSRAAFRRLAPLKNGLTRISSNKHVDGAAPLK